MLQGRWPNPLTLDAKNRFALPSRVRDGLLEKDAKELMVGVLQEPCLYLHNEVQHHRFLDRTFRHLGETRESRKLKTYIISRFVPVNTDSQGRITIPQLLLERAGIKKEVVLLAQDSRIELWPTEELDRLEAEAQSGSLDDALERVFADEQEEQRLLRRAVGPTGEGEVPSR